jgi:hypothetical protein
MRVNNEDIVIAIRCDHSDIIYILIILSLPPPTTTFSRWYLIIPIDSFIINIGHIMSKHADSTDGKLTTLSELLPTPLPLPMMARSNSRNTLQAIYTHAKIAPPPPPSPPPLHDHNDHHDQKDKVELNSVLSPYEYVVLEKIIPFIKGRDVLQVDCRDGMLGED